jgi:hypothetical protein
MTIPEIGNADLFSRSAGRDSVFAPDRRRLVSKSAEILPRRPAGDAHPSRLHDRETVRQACAQFGDCLDHRRGFGLAHAIGEPYEHYSRSGAPASVHQFSEIRVFRNQNAPLAQRAPSPARRLRLQPLRQSPSRRGRHREGRESRVPHSSRRPGTSSLGIIARQKHRTAAPLPRGLRSPRHRQSPPGCPRASSGDSLRGGRFRWRPRQACEGSAPP